MRKQIRYPKLHTYHIHHNLLETIIKAIRNTVTLSIKFLEVKDHMCTPSLLVMSVLIR